MKISRRDLLVSSASLSVASLLPSTLLAAPASKSSLRFVVLSDLHIQPELGAPEGVQLAIQKLLALRPRPDFVVINGDHVMDLLRVSQARAEVQFQLLNEALKPLQIPVHCVVGNHDIYGWGNKDLQQTDPEYGKRYLEDKVMHAPSYRSFDHGGWHFVILDSVQPDPSRGWRGNIDDAQLTWLKNDLAATQNPTVVFTHVPAISAIAQYTEGTLAIPNDGTLLANGREIATLCHQHGVKAVIQGHTHIYENIDYLGTQFVTAGAVCGDWWRGPRLGSIPEGFLVVDLNGNQFSSRYVPTGWKARTA